MRFSFLCLPDFPVAALSLAIDPLRVANEICGAEVFTWQVLAETPETVTASSNLRVNPDGLIADLTDTDVLLVFGGPLARFVDSSRTNGVLRRLLAHGRKVGAVSGSVLALAEEGYFDHRRCSVHFCYSAAVMERFPQVDCVETLISVDGNRISIAGSAAVFEFMLSIIAEEVSDAVSVETACWFQHATFRDEAAVQLLPGHSKDRTRNQLPHSIRQAVRHFADHLEDPILIQDAADLVGISLRSFERTFKSETGMSPGNYYRKLRLSAARQKVIFTDDPIRDIALSVGYQSVEAFSKNYSREFGRRPLRDRAQGLRRRQTVSGLGVEVSVHGSRGPA